MTERVTAKSVGSAFALWRDALRSKGGHVFGLRLTQEANVWRVVSFDESSPIPCGDSYGYLGSSPREAVTALRRATSMLGWLPHADGNNSLVPALALFNELEIDAARVVAARDLAARPEDVHTMNVTHVPEDESVVVMYRDRPYYLTTDTLPLANVPEHATMACVLRDAHTDREVTVKYRRGHVVNVFASVEAAPKPSIIG